MGYHCSTNLRPGAMMKRPAKKNKNHLRSTNLRSTNLRSSKNHLRSANPWTAKSVTKLRRWIGYGGLQLPFLACEHAMKWKPMELKAHKASKAYLVLMVLMDPMELMELSKVYLVLMAFKASLAQMALRTRLT